MVTNSVYKFIKRAALLRVQSGEGTVEEIVSIYTKLSEEQSSRMIEELNKELSAQSEKEQKNALYC